jgi:hypothetical protein
MKGTFATTMVGLDLLSLARKNGFGKKGQELDWMREIYLNHEKRLIIKLTAKFLNGLLGKLRSPQKHDAADEALDGIIDLYELRYLSLQSTRKKHKK